MVYSRLLSVYLSKKADGRRKALIHSIEGKLGENLKIIEEWVKESAGKQIITLLTEKKNLEIFNPSKAASDKDLEARGAIITTGIKTIFDKLINATTPENLSVQALSFLACISENNAVIPSGFMSEFELKRLQWTTYATLKNMNDKTSKLIIGCLVLLRILVFKLIMSPWDAFPEIEEKKANKVTLITVGSLIYQAVLDFFRINLQVWPNNMSHLPPDMRVAPMTTQMSVEAMNPYISTDDPIKPNKDEPILGLLGKPQMSNFIIGKKKMYDEIKSNVDGWLTKIFEMTHKMFTDIPKEKRYQFGIME